MNPSKLATLFEDWTRYHLRYIEEAEELLHEPEYLFDKIASQGWTWGDCDDAVLIVGSLMASVGIPIRIVAIKRKGSSVFEHVYLEAEIMTQSGQVQNDGMWVTVDPIVERQERFTNYATDDERLDYMRVPV